MECAAIRPTIRAYPCRSVARRLELTLGDQIYLEKDGLPPGLRNRLLRLAAFQNPEFFAAQAMRLPTYGKPRIIACAEDHDRYIGLPRGCLEEVQALLADLHIEVHLRDQRFAGTPLQAVFQGQLRPEQQTAARKMLAHDTGVLSATTAFGKTVVAAWLIAERGVNTMVLVHRRQLLDQWVERLSNVSGLAEAGDRTNRRRQKKATGKIDVAVIQSLVRKSVVRDCVGDYGHLIVDECHHVSARSFEMAARARQGEVCNRVVRHGHSQGRAPSDRLHAMRPSTISECREDCGDSTAIRAHRPRSSHIVSPRDRGGSRQADAVSRSLSGAHCR